MYSFLSIQAIQDITRKYDIPPEEIVELIYTRIDVNGEGKENISHEKLPTVVSPALLLKAITVVKI